MYSVVLELLANVAQDLDYFILISLPVAKRSQEESSNSSPLPVFVVPGLAVVISDYVMHYVLLQ